MIISPPTGKAKRRCLFRPNVAVGFYFAGVPAHYQSPANRHHRRFMGIDILCPLVDVDPKHFGGVIRRPGGQQNLVVDNSAYIEYYAGMKKLQHTIRGMPPVVDQAIRKRAQRTGKSFNATVIEALAIQILGNTDVQKAQTDIFKRLRGANTLDAGFDQAIKDQSKIDPKLWP